MTAATESPETLVRRVVMLSAAAALGIGAWGLSGNPLLGLVGLLAGVGFWLWASVSGIAVAATVVALLTVPPGVLGENSGPLAVAGLVVVAVSYLTRPRERAGTDAWFAVVVAALLAAQGVGVVASALGVATTDGLRFALTQLPLWFLAAAVVLLAYRRPGFTRRVLHDLTIAVAVMACSYWVSLVVLRGAGTVELQLPHRTVWVAPPVTLTAASGGYLPDLPRWAVVSGEPGLGGVYVLLAIATAMLLFRGRMRLVLLLALFSGVVATQSAGLLLAVAAGFAAWAALHAIRWLSPAALGLIVLAAVVGLRLLVALVLENKQGTNLASILDRGLGPDLVPGAPSLGGVTDTINLVAAAQLQPLTAVALFALLLVFLLRSLPSPVLTGYVAALAATALFAQPLQLQVGVWLMSYLLLALPRERPPRHAHRGRRAAPARTAPIVRPKTAAKDAGVSARIAGC
jgi:hypothetical protein